MSNISAEGEEEEEIGTEVEQEDDDKTPVLSRENSDVQNMSLMPVWKWKRSEAKGKMEEKPFSRAPSISSNSSRRNGVVNDDGCDKRSAEWKLRREFGASSPCRRKIEGSPASLHRASMLEGSPSSIRKSVTFDAASPVLGRKNSTISTTSLHSDSTLQTSVQQDLPESPNLLLRGSSKRAERSPKVQRRTTNPTIDSGIHFASPLAPRRREVEVQGLNSPLTKRKELETNSHSPVVRRKESLLSQTRHETFRRQSENSNSEPGPSSVRDNALRKHSFPEAKMWYADEGNAYRRGTEERKSLQVPLIASPILRTTSPLNKLLIRRASERISGAECAVSKLMSRQSPLMKSEWKQQSSTSVIDLSSTANSNDVNSARANSDNRSRINNPQTYNTQVRYSTASKMRKTDSTANEAAIKDTEHYYSTANGLRKDTAKLCNTAANQINRVGTDLRHPAANETRKVTELCSSTANEIEKAAVVNTPKNPSVKEDFKNNSAGLTATSASSDLRPRVSLQQREPTVSSSVGMRKKTRSILMEPLEVNWSVDEIRSKFQKASEPPPLLDTIYSSYPFK